MMNTYLAYWRRGWWCSLLLFATNMLVFVAVYPLAYLFFDSDALYWISSLVVAVTVVVPIWGLLFEVFAKRSTRIGEKVSTNE